MGANEHGVVIGTYLLFYKCHFVSQISSFIFKEMKQCGIDSVIIKKILYLDYLEWICFGKIISKL